MAARRQPRQPRDRSPLDAVLEAQGNLERHDATRPKLIDARAQAIQQARKAGWRLREIAEELDVSSERARQMGEAQ